MATSRTAPARPRATWLPPEDDLRRMGHVLTCDAGQPVVRRGMPAEHLYLIRTGSVKVVRPTRDTHKEYILSILGPGDVVGVEAVFGSGLYRSNAHAMAPSRVMALDRNRIQTFLRRHPASALKLLQETAEALETLEGRLVETAYEPGEKRLAHQMLELMDKFGACDNGHAHLSLDLTRTELAELVGLRPETTIRILSRWRDEGLLAERHKHLVIRDRRRLERLAQVEGPELAL